MKSGEWHIESERRRIENGGVESPIFHFLLLLVILLGSAFVRFYGVDWGLPFHFHSDEELLISTTVRLRHSLNPHISVYGTLPMFILGAISILSSFLGGFSLTDPNNLPLIYIIGRSISASFGTITVFLFYLLGDKFYDRKVGLLAAAFVAFTVGHLQASHFFTVEVMFIFFIGLTIYFAADIMRKGDLNSYLKTGIAGGLMMSTKLSGAPVMLVILLAHLMRWKAENSNRKVDKRWREILRIIDRKLILTFVLIAMIFLILNPYFLLDFKNFTSPTSRSSFVFHGRVATGAIKPHWTLQYEGTRPYIFHLKNLLFWGMGPLLEITSLIGVIYAFIRLKREDILLLAWVVPYFLLAGSWFAKFIRYILPIVPFLALLGARWAVEMPRRFPGKATSLAFRGFTALVLISSILYSFAYLNIYRQGDSRINAAEWIRENVEKGSTILLEWDLSAPPLGSALADDYKVEILDVHFYYERYGGGEDKNFFEENLREVDYIVMTERYYNQYSQAEKRFPLINEYYSSLFSGKLGFELIKTIKSFPSIFGFKIDDGSSELTFRLYDHLKVMIFKIREEA